MNELMEAIRARRERAVDVRATYLIEQVSPVTYLVQHPTEDERAYIVDLAQGMCDCPDFVCRANQLQIRCKHMIAVEVDTGEQIALPDTSVTICQSEIGSRRVFVVNCPYHESLVDMFRKISGEWVGARLRGTSRPNGVRHSTAARGWVFPDSGRVLAQLRLIFPRLELTPRLERIVQDHYKAVKAGRTAPAYID